MSTKWTGSLPAGVAVLALVLGGCFQGGDKPGSGETEGGDGTAGSGDDGGDDDGGDDAGPADELPAPHTRFFRLTHEQWENTVRDLFHLSDHTGFSTEFRLDPYVSGFVFDNNALALEVDQALWAGYQRAAADAAELAVSTQSILDAILPPDTGDEAARIDTFIREFGLRVYRRPLTDSEVDAYVQRFAQAPDLYPGSSTFDAGLRFTIETLFQSPFFLYRVEQSTEIDGEVIPLDSYELAQRMSYFLWNSLPDQELFDAAALDELQSRDPLEAQARRMLADGRAELVVDSFHHQLLDVDKFLTATPSPAFFPDVSDQIGEFATTEYQMFIHDLVFAREAGVSEMMTTTNTFVNADLAAIYGLEGSYGAEFVPATLDASERRGFFTMVGFLAGHASSVDPDPIHRGVFLARRMSCLQIAAPPDDVPPLPPPDPTKTNRELVEEHTEAEGSVCSSCHSTLINPFGFPYEMYDAVGAFRTEDKGFPVDTATEVLLGGQKVAVADALELADLLASTDAVHECYMRHWIEYAQGRPAAPEDSPLRDRLGLASLEDEESIQELIIQLVVSRPFRARATEELP